MVTVISAGNNDDFPFDGRTVADVRTALKELYKISDSAIPTLDGQRVDEDTVLPAGGELTFSATVAQKG
jgi:hypothetical protein